MFFRWILVLFIGGENPSMVVIPQEYPTKTQCEEAREAFRGQVGDLHGNGACIPAPKRYGEPIPPEEEDQ